VNLEEWRWIGRRPTEGVEEFGRRPHLRVPAGRAGLLFLAGAGGQATRALLLLVDKEKGSQDSRVPTGGDTSLLDFPLKKKLSFGFGLDLDRQTRGSMLRPTPLLYLYICSYVLVQSYVCCEQIPNLFLSETNSQLFLSFDETNPRLCIFLVCDMAMYE
jgi:hypothetical protein